MRGSAASEPSPAGFGTVGDMQWMDVTTRRGVTERRFDVVVDKRTVPGLLWTPEGATGPRPLVLIGHGAALHKRVAYVLYLARHLVRRHGFAAAAIDGPIHGDRRRDRGVDPMRVFAEFAVEWSRPTTIDEMVADWQGTLDALRKCDDIGEGPVGYWGVSMGSIYGLPFVAADLRVDAAVLGLLGLAGPTRARLEADARTLTCPVLFLQQWNDEFFARQTVLDLFDAIGSSDKRLHVQPGAHAAVPPEELEHSVAFLVKHLAPTTATPPAEPE
jgi:dienelactone hydrolase